MALLYGRHYSSRYQAIADLIQPASTVLDLCCGPGVLYRRFLRKKAVNYTGIDLNSNFKLDQLFVNLNHTSTKSFLINGGREKVYVLAKA